MVNCFMGLLICWSTWSRFVCLLGYWRKLVRWLTGLLVHWLTFNVLGNPLTFHVTCLFVGRRTPTCNRIWFAQVDPLTLNGSQSVVGDLPGPAMRIARKNTCKMDPHYRNQSRSQEGPT